MKRPSLTRRIIGTAICIAALLLAPARFEVECWQELERLWQRRRK